MASSRRTNNGSSRGSRSSSAAARYGAAEEVAGADPDTLQPLLDKSLLRKRDASDEPRYWMLETIREYAVERLEASGEEDELRRRHAEWFVALAEDAEPHLTGSPKAWLDRLEDENDNVRTALDYLEASGSGESMQRLCGAIWRFWLIRGHIAESRRWLEAALEADSRATIARGRTLNGATVMASETGDRWGGPTARRRGGRSASRHRRPVGGSDLPRASRQRPCRRAGLRGRTAALRSCAGEAPGLWRRPPRAGRDGQHRPDAGGTRRRLGCSCPHRGSPSSRTSRWQPAHAGVVTQLRWVCMR